MFVTGHSAVFAQGTELKGMTSAPFAAVGAARAPVTQVAQVPVVVAPPVAVVRAAVLVAPAAAVAVVKPVPAVAVAAAPVAFVTPVARPAIVPVAYASAPPTEDRTIRYAQLLRAQQGFRGRNAQQGWTISD
jgi:hypothetical protein